VGLKKTEITTAGIQPSVLRYVETAAPAGLQIDYHIPGAFQQEIAIPEGGIEQEVRKRGVTLKDEGPSRAKESIANEGLEVHINPGPIPGSPKQYRPRQNWPRQVFSRQV